MKGALEIDELSGQRCDLAVDLLETGDDIVSFEQLLLYRDTNGPHPMGVIDAEIWATLSPKQLTSRRVEADIARGLQCLALVVADEGVRRLADQFGLVRHYVRNYFYDNYAGRAGLALVEPDGSVGGRSRHPRRSGLTRARGARALDVWRLAERMCLPSARHVAPWG